MSWTWWRGGVRVGKPGSATYRVTVADVGAPVTVLLRAVRRGYTALSSRSRATARVRSVPHLRVTARRVGTRARLAATVTAAGVRPVTGAVRISWRGRSLGVRTLRRGGAVVLVRGLPPGTRRVLLRYSGSTEVSPRTVHRTVRVR